MSDETYLIREIIKWIRASVKSDLPYEFHAKKIKEFCIESDEALEYWKQQFVEQACEAIDEIGSTPLTYNIDIPEEEEIISGYMQGRSEAYNEIKQAIKDKFK